MKKRGHFKIKTWQLLVVLIPLFFIDATLLRVDHVRMVDLRDAVLAADEAENDEEITKTLTRLKQFVFSNIIINVVEENGVQHIAFGTGPFYLEHQYIRAANAALDAAEKTLASDNNPHGNIYLMASEVCQPQAIANGWSWSDANYINCMMTEINKHPAADELQDKIVASLPSTELYRKEYASPIWAPSFTGFMILITLGIIIVILIRGVIWIIVRISVIFI